MAKIVGSMFDPDGEQYKFFDLPLANYASSNYDRVVDADGNTVGLSMFTGYSYNEKKALSLAHHRPRDPARHRAPRRLGRGERRHKKTTVEPHKQIDVRAIVSPVPYEDGARNLCQGWRTARA